MQGLKNVLLNDEFSPICYLYIMYVAICVSLCVCMYLHYVCMHISIYLSISYLSSISGIESKAELRGREGGWSTRGQVELSRKSLH